MRRLAAIMLTDMVAYSKLMALDEARTISLQKEHRRRIIDPIVAEKGGRIIKSTGDGILAEFPSIVWAAECAIRIQSAIADLQKDAVDNERIQYRIGLNIGDIIVDEDDVAGDGVNVASRLEALARPGGICISGAAYDQLVGKTKFSFADAGKVEVKNIPRLIQVWRWPADDVSGSAKATVSYQRSAIPSVTVEPFQNVANAPEFDFMRQGFAQQITALLSKFSSLTVRWSSNQPDDGIGKPTVTTLGGGYVVNGSFLTHSGRVRITCQLVEADSGNNLWADQFDEELDDVFELYDRAARRVVMAVEPGIQTQERMLALRKSPENLNAWELVRRGDALCHRQSKDAFSEAIYYFKKAIRKEPELATAYSHLAFASFNLAVRGFTSDSAKAMAEGRAAAEEALSLDGNEVLAHYALGRILLWNSQPAMALGEMKEAVRRNDKYAGGHFGLGYVFYYGFREAERAIKHFGDAIDLNPNNPVNWAMLHHKGSALRFLGKFDEAVACCDQACQGPPRDYLAYMNHAAALAEANEIDRALLALQRASSEQPLLSESFLRQEFGWAHDDVLESLVTSLRKINLKD